MDDADESSSPSLDHSDINDPMIVAVESIDLSKKRKLRTEESDLLPMPKHCCLEQQASLLDSSSCPSSDIEYAECSYAMEDSIYSTGSSSSGIDQHCSKVDDTTQEVDEDFTEMEFICPDSKFAVEDLQIGSYVLSSARWSVGNQESEEATKKPTIDQEFEQYFSTLMM